MDFEFYRNFITVAETGNLTAASRKLALAQPALSAQLKTLEKHYGTQLIKKGRGRRHILLTEAGEEFLRKAQQLCRTEENIVLDMQSFARQAAGTLRFSVSYVAVPLFLDEYVVPFTRAYPQVNYQLREEAVTDQLVSLRNGLSDLAYANAPLPERQAFCCRQIRRERFAAVLAVEAFPKLAAQDSVTIPELAAYPLACNFGCYGLLRQLFGCYGASPSVQFASTTGTAAVRFAAAGAAVAVVSADCAAGLPKGVKAIGIAEEKLYFEQTLYWLKDAALSPLARLFLKHCGIPETDL